MRKILPEERDDASADRDAERQTRALAGFVLILALAIVGFYLVIHLRAVGRIEDCLLAQHSNCDALLGLP